MHLPFHDSPAGIKFPNHNADLLHSADIMRKKGMCSLSALQSLSKESSASLHFKIDVCKVNRAMTILFQLVHLIYFTSPYGACMLPKTNH